MPINDAILSSTHETEAELAHAAGNDWRKPFEPKAAEPEVPAVEAPETDAKSEEPAADSEPATPESKPEAEKPKAETDSEKEVKKLLKRIDKLTAQKYSSESEKEELRSRLEAIERKLAEAKPAAAEDKKTPAADEPRPDQFKTYEEFVKAQARWEARQEIHAELTKRETEQATQSEQARAREVFDAYNKKVSQARQEFEDFDEVVGQDLKIPKSAELHVLEADNGPQIAYFLGQNPEICEKLLELSDARVGIEIGKISAFLEAKAPAPEVPPAPKPNVSTAPPPIKPVGGTARTASVPLGEASYEEYRKARAEQVKNRYRS